ncbi:serine/threonine-protein phosphatase 1 regulatory subunit 10-like isoform X1 [Onthophagus taurus]|uniref:serine/threonine-protein phosphatase 1 regulatory subunit 10-like isoform X1 n=1 Tax=Onthophagus taurus TaxID=166361 RepID=UPI0039BDFA95
MPRIDPLQLLNCLTVLLNPNGGILSKNEVQRLASLMTKFSKKLVSKCVYILILKSTETQLLGQFMLEGGWNLVHLWMQDGINNQNWPLVKELLELLLMAPTDIEQLKTNNLPKLVKSLTKRDDTYNICELSNELVENWLKIVKDSQNKPLSTIPNNNILSTIGGFEELTGVRPQQIVENQESEESPEKIETLKIVTVKKSDDKSQSESYKIALRDGKAVLCKISKVESNENASKDSTSSTSGEERIEDVKTELEDKIDGKKKESLEKKEKSNHDRHRSKSSSKSSSSRKDRDKDKEKSRDKSSSQKSSSSSSKDRSKNDKHRSNGVKSSSKSSSSSSSKDKKDSKEKQAEKDKDTLTKIQPQALQKIGRIPKKDEKSKDETKKPTFSIEVRKGTEDKPKTVKVYKAKMRSTGLLDEPKPPPPRIPKKTVAPIPANIPPPKRPSPIRETIPPPEKKSRLDPSERPGSIKLIPPKPKPAVLQESDIFMDALTASANSKKEPKKKKRRASVSKDTPSSPSEETPTTPTTPTTSLITPANFYQDTLNTENGDKEGKEDTKDEDGSATPTDAEEKMDVTENRDPTELRGVLVHVKKKGPKRSIRWKPDAELVEVQYFELDETERINVYKTFGEMSKMEMCGERQALQMSRNRQSLLDDNMEPKTAWRLLIEIDVKPALVEPGLKSLEKDIQFAREKTTISLPPFLRLTDTPAEPDPEVHQRTDPIPIPLEDPENGESADTTVQPWPEPKGSPPHVPQVPQIFPMQQTFPNFNMPNPPQQFQNPPFTPNFMPPNMMQGNMNMAMNGPNMMPNMPPEMMNPQNMFVGPKPDNFNQPEFNQFNQNQNMMFPQNNFNMRGRGGFRGRGGMGNGPWVRMNGPGPGAWNQRGGGVGMPPRGAPPGRICKNVRNHGYCRNSNNCPFFHPN